MPMICWHCTGLEAQPTAGTQKETGRAPSSPAGYPPTLFKCTLRSWVATNPKDAQDRVGIKAVMAGRGHRSGDELMGEALSEEATLESGVTVRRQASVPEGVWKEQFSKWELFVQSPASNIPDTLKEQGRETKPVRVVVEEVRAEGGRSVWHLCGIPHFDEHSCPPGKKLYKNYIEHYLPVLFPALF